MKTIYLISHAKMFAGPVNQALNILTGMKHNGRVDSTLVTLAPEEGRNWLYRFKDNDIKIVQMNQPMWKTWNCIPMLRKYVKENNIDLVHACGYRADFVALFAGKSVKKIITQRCHPYEIVEKFPKFLQPLFSRLYFQMIKRMDAIVACSKTLQSTFMDEFGMNVYAVQNGVNTNFFVPVSAKEKIVLRSKLSINSKGKIYLVLGSFLERKNNKVIVETFKKYLRTNNDAQVIFVGNGAQESILKELAAGNPDIIFAGITKKPLEYLQASDVLVSSSLAEGLPNTVLESLSCGIPVILSNIGPHKEIIEGTNAGVIFDKNSSTDLLKCLNESEKWDLKSKSQTARMIAIDNFSIDVLAKNYEDVYKSVLCQK